jgi:hypothetical protein
MNWQCQKAQSDLQQQGYRLTGQNGQNFRHQLLLAQSNQGMSKMTFDSKINFTVQKHMNVTAILFTGWS